MRNQAALRILFVPLFLTGCSPLFKNPNNQKKDRHVQSDLSCPYDFEQLDVCANVFPLELPIPVKKKTTFQLKFWSKETGTPEGPYIDPPGIPYIWLWMEMGTGSHGSSPITTTPAHDDQGRVLPGVFDLKNVFFTMSKLWEVHVELKDSGGNRIDEAENTIWID